MIVRSFHFVAGQLTVSKGLNRGKIAQYLTKRLEKNQSCMPDANIAKPGMDIRVKMTFASKGKIQSLDTTPKMADLADCLKKRLSSKTDAFKPKAGAAKPQTSFRLHIQGQ